MCEGCDILKGLYQILHKIINKIEAGNVNFKGGKTKYSQLTCP